MNNQKHQQNVLKHQQAYAAWMAEMDEVEAARDLLLKKAALLDAERERDGVLIDEVAL